MAELGLLRQFAKLVNESFTGSNPVLSAKPTSVEVGKYYRVRTTNGKESIVKYEGIPKSYHCKTCSCVGPPSFVLVSGDMIVGSFDLSVLEEVNKPD